MEPPNPQQPSLSNNLARPFPLQDPFAICPFPVLPFGSTRGFAGPPKPAQQHPGEACGGSGALPLLRLENSGLKDGFSTCKEPTFGWYATKKYVQNPIESR